MALNAPWLWHRQRRARPQERRDKDVHDQGLAQPSSDLLAQVCAIFSHAGRDSSLYRHVHEGEAKAYKDLILKPFARYADSLKARLLV